jgi:hypothetical protein
MALTDTKKAKEFVAGAPNIILKGDLRPDKMMASYGYDDAMGETFEEFQRLKKIGEIPMEMEFDDYLDQLDRDIPFSKKQKQKNQMMASVDDPFYRSGDEDEHSMRMFGKPYKELNADELDEFQEEMMRLMNKFSSTSDERNMRADLDAVKDGYSELMFGKPVEALTPEELEEFKILFEMEYYGKKQNQSDRKIAAYGGRAQYGLGSLVKSVKKAVKGVVSGVKDNPLLAAAALNFAPMLAGGQPFFGLGGLKGSVKTFGNPLSFLNLSDGVSKTDKAMDALKVGGAGATITGLLSQKEELNTGDPDDANRRAEVIEQLKVQFSRLYPKGENESPEDYDVRITAMVNAADDSTTPVGNMAEGGRIGYAGGSYKDRIQNMADEIAQDDYGQDFYDLGKKLQDKVYERAMRKISDAFADKADMMRKNEAEGGRIGYAMGDSASENAMQAAGIEGLPVRQNPKGVKELDLRKTGGFIPPVGVKEKADDIPAMLSNNEFVFTADAVRAAGGGSVNKGAQRMYDLMKSLESKVV